MILKLNSVVAVTLVKKQSTDPKFKGSNQAPSGRGRKTVKIVAKVKKFLEIPPINFSNVNETLDTLKYSEV